MGHSYKKAFSVVEIILVVAVIALAGSLAWVLFSQQNKTDTPANNEATTSEEEKKSDDQTTTTPIPTEDPNKGYLVAKEWGIRFKAPAGLKDVEYTIAGDMLAIYAKPADSTVEFIPNYTVRSDNNHPNHAVGRLVRSSSPTKQMMDSAVQGKKVGSSYYYTYGGFSNIVTGMACAGLYGTSDAACTTEMSVFELVTMSDDSLLGSIEESL